MIEIKNNEGKIRKALLTLALRSCAAQPPRVAEIHVIKEQMERSSNLLNQTVDCPTEAIIIVVG